VSLGRVTNLRRPRTQEEHERRSIRSQDLSEIRDRLKESRAAVQEYERLQAALRALDSETDGTRRAQTRPRPRRSNSSPRKQRAARGANREKALAVIADRPGVTVAELASATRIAKGVVYSLTRTLEHTDISSEWNSRGTDRLSPREKRRPGRRPRRPAAEPGGKGPSAAAGHVRTRRPDLAPRRVFRRSG
jgi:hypothetical protein